MSSASSGDFVCLRFRLQFGNIALSIAGPVEWNKLPESVPHSTSAAQFKYRLKTHLFRIDYDRHMVAYFSQAAHLCEKLVFTWAR